jgi:hypothetical protein
LLLARHSAFARSQLAIMGQTLRMERNYCQRVSPCALTAVCASGMWRHNDIVQLKQRRVSGAGSTTNGSMLAPG